MIRNNLEDKNKKPYNHDYAIEIWYLMTKSDRCTYGLIIGVDASNLREGGGMTHLSEMLRDSKLEELSIHRVIVWGGKKTLEMLWDRPWLSKIFSPEIDHGWFSRIYWQKY